MNRFRPTPRKYANRIGTVLIPTGCHVIYIQPREKFIGMASPEDEEESRHAADRAKKNTGLVLVVDGKWIS